jgi:hypothetical protein
MPNTREKLIELMMQAKIGWTKGEFADHLIANGVTFATDNKWIPVTERLPEEIDQYIVVVKSKYDFEDEYCIDTDLAIYNPYERAYIDGCWTTFNDWDEGQQYIHITHWMPLPSTEGLK